MFSYILAGQSPTKVRYAVDFPVIYDERKFGEFNTNSAYWRQAEQSEMIGKLSNEFSEMDDRTGFVNDSKAINIT